jgi:hypothetical protein
MEKRGVVQGEGAEPHATKTASTDVCQASKQTCGDDLASKLAETCAKVSKDYNQRDKK